MRHEDRLLEPRPRFVMLELTSRCNLRCVYCAVSQPDFHGRDLEVPRERIVDDIVGAAVEEVQLNGHGETTIVRDWQVLAADLLARGIHVSMTSNLALRLKPDELDVIARFKSLTVSCDTSDPALFASLRRGTKLERVEENMARIQEARRATGLSPLYIAINCTLVDRVVDGLPELVRWSAALGLQCVSVLNHVSYPDVAPDFPVRNPAEACPELALRRIREAQAEAERLDLDFHVMGGLIELLEAGAAP